MSNHTTGVEALEPRAVWEIFAGLSAHPRPSKHEEAVRGWVLEQARSRGFEARVDEVGNVLIEVPATPGHEGAAVTVIQGHLDMVTEANAGSTHDFMRDPIRLIVDTDPDNGRPIVRADETTLGADNGIGVALGLAAAFSPEVVHGPLEILLTVDEEMGMTGAKSLGADFFQGRQMINLDSEDDRSLYIGCAGGLDTTMRWHLALSASQGEVEGARVVVSGLRGGHSGADIHENRGNALKLLVRTLRDVGVGPLGLASLDGGSKRNAIPREARAVVVGRPGLVEALTRAAAAIEAQGREESIEPGLVISVEAAPVGLAASFEASAGVLSALSAVPSGVINMHPRFEGLVQTSNNLSTAISKAGDGALSLEVGLLSRSSSMSLLGQVADGLRALASLSRATIEQGGQYPGWDPNPDSRLLALCRQTFTEVFDRQPEVLAIHAGLECGLISDRVGGQLDAISFGPDIKGAHSPTERVYVDSVQKVWRLLQAVLAQLAATPS